MVDKAVKQINPTTYEVEMPSGDKVEIGNREAVSFKPHIKLNRWGGECFIKVGLPAAENITPGIEAGRVKWRGQKIGTRFYPLEPKVVTTKDANGRDVPFTQNELGSFEFEIILKEKPATNKIILDIDTKGLRFSYQPPLHPDHPTWNEKAFCPENVVGSYAVYHATKKNNEYMAGKAFHIYRPIAEDALGNEVWCAIQFDKYIAPTSLTLTIPQQFLDEATYPITIDPNLGFTGIGGNVQAIAENPGVPVSTRVGSAWTMPAGGGTANFIRAYIGAFDTPDCKVFINQKDSGGAGTHAQIATKENLACGADYHWEEFTLADEGLTEAVVYILNIIGDGSDVGLFNAYYIKYDVDGAVASYREADHNYVAPESPWVVDPEATKDSSIYCNYTGPGWSGKISGVTNPAKVMGVDVANIAKVKGVVSA